MTVIAAILVILPVLSLSLLAVATQQQYTSDNINVSIVSMSTTNKK